jgi:hypothetical protein
MNICFIYCTSSMCTQQIPGRTDKCGTSMILMRVRKVLRLKKWSLGHVKRWLCGEALLIICHFCALRYLFYNFLHFFPSTVIWSKQYIFDSLYCCCRSFISIFNKLLFGLLLWVVPKNRKQYQGADTRICQAWSAKMGNHMSFRLPRNIVS